MRVADLKGRTVGVCVSGGLDSKTITKVLTSAGVNVVAFSADIAQPDERDINDIKKRMAPCGVETVIVDLKNDMADICYETIKCQAMYDGGYWNSTGIARAITVRGLLKEMKKRKCSVLAHGATGRGNDQMRFERYTNVLEPKFLVYSPWRDPELLAKFPGRTEQVAYLKQFGIVAFAGGKKKYSTDANLAGLSHEAEDLESMETSMRIVK
ncbi:MAG: argininosuccinate synthase, partial [Kiritimatiellae bacterium]|nr:argininosuccinate synthase [Kiritimatiellia bacterium]